MRTRHRDRRGRGVRGPLAPPEMPVTRSRSEQFDELVLDAVERLERRWAEQLRDVELAIEEIPPVTDVAAAPTAVRLGQVMPSAGRAPSRIVVYRRPVENRARTVRAREQLVYDVVVEQVAELLGLTPEAVDPDYGGAGDGG